MWLTLFASLVGQLVGFILLTWLVIWLIVVAPRIVHHEKLTGSGRIAWDVALPIGGLGAIIIIGRALLDWSVR